MSKVIIVDIDGVVAAEVPNPPEGYARAQPLAHGVRMVQKAVAAGHEVKFYTARWEADREVTIKWLEAYGLPTDVTFGKPLGDIYIDDRARRFPDVLSLLEELLR